MPGRTRTLIILLSAVGALGAGATPAAAQSAPVIHACYVPLTGTVYRIKEDGLRTTCSSTSHIEFQWTDGDGALRPPVGAAAGDLLQFDGSQWRPVSAASLGGGGGVTGYEVVTLTATNTYQPPAQLVILTQGQTLCNVIQLCTFVVYTYRVVAPGTSVTLSCPVGKKAFGVFAGGDIGTDIIASGQVTAALPLRQRDGPQQSRTLQPGESPNPFTLPNTFPNLPSTTPDVFPVKAICANAS